MTKVVIKLEQHIAQDQIVWVLFDWLKRSDYYATKRKVSAAT